MLHYDRRMLQNAVKNILDGELLNKYLYLSTMERSELAKKIGTTADIVSAELNYLLSNFISGLERGNYKYTQGWIEEITNIHKFWKYIEYIYKNLI